MSSRCGSCSRSSSWCGVTIVTVTVGDRALQMHSAVSFIVENEITLAGMFSQNGFQTIKEGAPSISFSTMPPGASITPELRQFRGASARGRSPCRGRSRAPLRSAARRCFRQSIDTRRDEPRPASAGNVRQRHRVCRQRGRDRPSGVDSGVGGFQYGLSLAGQTQNDQNARKKRTSLDCPARFR